MIALSHHLPFIRVGENNIVPCQSEWLEQKMLDATEDMNLPEVVSLSVAQGVCSYLQNSYQGTVISLDELNTKIEETLKNVGLTEASSKLDRSPPPVKIDLVELAKTAKGKKELAFLQLFEDKCHEAVTDGAHYLVIDGFNECVAELKGDCRISLDRLKALIQARIDDVRKEGEISLPVFNVSLSEN